MTIFDLMTAPELAAYWQELVQDEAPYPCEELFPDDKKLGLNLKWLKGAKGLPVVLRTSAFDAKAIVRGRIGFDKLSAEMPYFKESTYIDEELRQELNMVLETGNQAYIDSVMNRVFDDELRLLRGARASRERMRMMALTTGIVSMVANGQAFTFDYGVPANHKGNATVDWSDSENADPIEDIRVAQQTIKDETGAICSRGMCSGKVWRQIRACKSVIRAIYTNSVNATQVREQDLKNFLAEELGLTILVNDMRYKDEAEQTLPFMPADTMVLFPEGDLGKTWFGTTPAESDLMSSKVENVSIVDTGVSILTKKETDPVQVETIVAMICLPSFEAADEIYILDTKAA